MLAVQKGSHAAVQLFAAGNKGRDPFPTVARRIGRLVLTGTIRRYAFRNAPRTAIPALLLAHMSPGIGDRCPGKKCEPFYQSLKSFESARSLPHQNPLLRPPLVQTPAAPIEAQPRVTSARVGLRSTLVFLLFVWR